jgi:hypothetical protein
MTRTITNRSRAPVSFRGNGGQTWHLIPSTSITLPDAEVTNNPKVQKLEGGGLIAVRRADELESDAGERQRTGPRRSRRDEKR